MIPVGTLLRLEERFHTYQMIVLARFPVFFNNEPLWHYELNFFRDGSNLGTLAFDEIELMKLINSGEMKILSEGAHEDF
jgi:hypothetical protein|tara:strand:+ start:291 stop:527 length:237 start_codon:yes stop_codon:yes gene_type:complete